MALADKYGDVLGLAQKVGVKNGDWKEEGGKIQMSGTTTYQLEANLTRTFPPYSISVLEMKAK